MTQDGIPKNNTSLREIDLDPGIKKTGNITISAMDYVYRVFKKDPNIKKYKSKYLPKFDILVGNSKYFEGKNEDLDILIVDPTIDKGIGLVHLAKYGKGFEGAGVQVRSEYQGAGIGTKIYEFIIKELGILLISGDTQSPGSAKLWRNLFKTPGITVYGYNPYADDMKGEERFFHVDDEHDLGRLDTIYGKDLYGPKKNKTRSTNKLRLVATKTMKNEKRKTNESSTTSGSIATVAGATAGKPMSRIGQGIYPDGKSGSLLKGKKTNKKFANSVNESQEQGVVEASFTAATSMSAANRKQSGGKTAQPTHGIKVGDTVTTSDGKKGSVKFVHGDDIQVTGTNPYYPDKVTKHSAKDLKKGVTEAKLDEEDVIIVPGMRKSKDKSFISRKEDRRDHEVQMAKSDLYATAKNAMRIFDALKTRTEDEGIMGWQQSYITLAADYLNSVAESMEFESKDTNEMTGGVIAGGGVGEDIEEGKVASALGALGLLATLGLNITTAKDTPLGKELEQAASSGDRVAAYHLNKLDVYVDSDDQRTLTNLKIAYIDDSDRPDVKAYLANKANQNSSNKMRESSIMKGLQNEAAKKMKGEDPCWKGYEMIGKKKKNGKEVPNCVPKKK